MRSSLLGGLVGLPLLLAACGRGEEGPPEPDPEAVALGREVYRAYCASCHGPDAEGTTGWQTPNEAGELPAPPHDSTGHTWKHSDAMLYDIVSEGWRDPFNRTERLTMPAFGSVLSPRQIGAVATYLKTLWTSEQRAFQLKESQDEPFPPEAASGATDEER